MGLDTFFLLVDGAASKGGVRYLELPDTANIGAFRLAVLKHFQSYLPPGLCQSDLKVFKNKTTEEPLRLSTKLAGYGASKSDPLIVQVLKVWFQQVGSSDCVVDSLPLSQARSVEILKREVLTKVQPLLPPGIAASDLTVLANKVAQVPLEADARLGDSGASKSVHSSFKCPRSGSAVATVQQSTEQQIAFIVLESSSGMGKTQMAFNLMARDDIDVFYIVCGVGGVNAQRVYSAFETRSVVFANCVLEDTKGMQSGDVSEIITAGALQTYGLICALLTGSETMDKKATRKEVDEALHVWKKRAGDKHCLVFLDEFPREEPSRFTQIQLMRNVFRSFRLPVILSSTNGTARNLINYGQHSRGEKDKTLWCVVLPAFPSFRDPFLDRLRPDLRSIIQHSRPLFAREAVDFVKETESKETTAFDEAADLVGLMDRIAAKLGREIARAKGNTLEFRCGQLRLFLAANYVHADCNGLIDKHYARLREDKKFKLSIPPGGKAQFRIQPKAARKMQGLSREDSSRCSKSNKLRDFVKKTTKTGRGNAKPNFLPWMLTHCYTSG